MEGFKALLVVMLIKYCIVSKFGYVMLSVMDVANWYCNAILLLASHVLNADALEDVL